MYLDIEAVKRATNSLDHVSQLLTGAHAAVRTLNPAPFSVVSGLDQAGQMHQAISSVSEPEATRGLAQFCYVHRVFGHGVRCLFGHGIHGVLGHF